MTIGKGEDPNGNTIVVGRFTFLSDFPRIKVRGEVEVKPSSGRKTFDFIGLM